MDQTEQYIEMCVKLPSEIKKRVPIDHHGSAGGDKSFFGYSKRLNGMVWLPRQDQLQDMLKNETIESIADSYEFQRGSAPHGLVAMQLVKDLDLFQLENYNCIRYAGINSMEQLWLAFIMHEKFNKKWTGSEWIKQ